MFFNSEKRKNEKTLTHLMSIEYKRILNDLSLHVDKFNENIEGQTFALEDKQKTLKTFHEVSDLSQKGFEYASNSGETMQMLWREFYIRQIKEAQDILDRIITAYETLEKKE